MLWSMSERKLSREESLARAHAANRRKRLDRLADELRLSGFVVLTPEQVAQRDATREGFRLRAQQVAQQGVNDYRAQAA